jgi:hypothetical protein
MTSITVDRLLADATFPHAHAKNFDVNKTLLPSRMQLQEEHEQSTVVTWIVIPERRTFTVVGKC